MMKLPFELTVFGSGKIDSSLLELGSIRLEEITVVGAVAVPVNGKQPAVLVALQGWANCGSRMRRLKMPCRSLAVGTLKNAALFGDWLGRSSIEKKKNNFCLLTLK